MASEKDIRVVLWDFDGVLLDSNKVREIGFQQVLADFPEEQVQKLVVFHKQNGGLSRYVKFRYFFEDIRGEQITQEQIQELAGRFSVIMKKLLTNPDLLIQESLDYIRRNFQTIPMHIVSGSDQTELRYLCEVLNISSYFRSISGSPTHKNDLVSEVLAQFKYDRDECVLVGDSINDYEAARINKLHFLAYNNVELDKYTTLKSKLF